MKHYELFKILIQCLEQIIEVVNDKGKLLVIKKELVTIQSEAWFDEKKEHRYVFRRQWFISNEKEKIDSLTVVITIRPGSVNAYVEDLTMMLIEKNIRQLGFDGFIAVNLFSSIRNATKADLESDALDVIATVLKDKLINQFVFSCGSILYSNKQAADQARRIYELLSSKQKKQAQVLIDKETERFAYPLHTKVRNKWSLSSFNQELLNEIN